MPGCVKKLPQGVQQKLRRKVLRRQARKARAEHLVRSSPSAAKRLLGYSDNDKSLALNNFVVFSVLFW